ncbi:MAG: site-specific DNA-methyltransferase [Phycisphaeraceae bacterium]|nr:site-specific DNA-methyltransferase [Phycisphaeraceae bacterium]
MLPFPRLQIIHGPAEIELQRLPFESVDLCWTDPPWNTGSRQKHSSGSSYRDSLSFDDFRSLIVSMGREVHRLLKPTGSLFALFDFRAVHDAKTWIDGIFGRDNFRGEIIWHSELGASFRCNRAWNVRHHTILWYSKSDAYYFDASKIPRVKRKSPRKGYEGDKPADSVWTYTLSNTARERVNYPSQKPLAIIRPIIEVHTKPDEVVLDPFGGSGSTAHAALSLGRRAISIDQNPESIAVQHKRLETISWGGINCE